MCIGRLVFDNARHLQVVRIIEPDHLAHRFTFTKIFLRHAFREHYSIGSGQSGSGISCHPLKIEYVGELLIGKKESLFIVPVFSGFHQPITDETKIGIFVPVQETLYAWPELPPSRHLD